MRLLPRILYQPARSNATDLQLKSEYEKYDRYVRRSAGGLVVLLVVAVVLFFWKFNGNRPWQPEVFAAYIVAIAASVFAQIYFQRKWSTIANEIFRRSDVTVADLNVRFSKLALENASLQKQVGPRRIGVGQVFVETLKRAPPAKALVIVSEGASDGVRLASEIYAHLREATWETELPQIVSVRSARVVGNSYFGVSVVARSLPNEFGKEMSSYAALVEALRAELGAAGTCIDSKLPDGEFRIVINPKP